MSHRGSRRRRTRATRSWRHRFEAAVAPLADLWPAEPAAADDVAEAYRFLGVTRPQAFLAVGDALGALLAVVTGGSLLLVAPTVVPLGLVVGAGPPFLVRRGAVLLAEIERTRALGAVPALYARLVLRLQVEPSLERAVRFAARGGDDRLSESLSTHASAAAATPETGLRSFASTWGTWAPTIERASALVAAAARAPPPARRRGCERALETVLDGTRERLASFADDVRGPVTGLYAFGVLLPLALVGVLPAARVAGVTVPASLLVGLYDVALPVGLAAASCWLVSRRPVAFPAPRVGSDHPAVPDRRARAVLLGFVVGGSAVVAVQFVVPWGAPVVAAGVGIGVALVDCFGPAREIRERVRAVERGLPDALTLVGRRVSEGTAVEQALTATAGELPGATGDLFAAATTRGRTLGLDVAGSFVGPRGVLRDVPSPRARDVATLLTLAATEGQPAGDVLVAAGDHLRDLRRVERDGRRELAAITGTLTNTAVLFGPLVGGVTVAMAGRLASDATTSAAAPTTAATTSTAATATTANGAASVGGALALSTPVLGQVVGIYVLLLAAELTALSTVLERGLDPALVAYRVGVALPVASVAYLVAVVVAGRLL